MLKSSVIVEGIRSLAWMPTAPAVKNRIPSFYLGYAQIPGARIFGAIRNGGHPTAFCHSAS
jgi:hypothetical protein